MTLLPVFQNVRVANLESGQSSGVISSESCWCLVHRLSRGLTSRTKVENSGEETESRSLARSPFVPTSVATNPKF